MTYLVARQAQPEDPFIFVPRDVYGSTPPFMPEKGPGRPTPPFVPEERPEKERPDFDLKLPPESESKRPTMSTPEVIGRLIGGLIGNAAQGRNVLDPRGFSMPMQRTRRENPFEDEKKKILQGLSSQEELLKRLARLEEIMEGRDGTFNTNPQAVETTVGLDYEVSPEATPLLTPIDNPVGEGVTRIQVNPYGNDEISSLGSMLLNKALRRNV